MVPVGAGTLPGWPSLQCAAAHPGWQSGTGPTAGAGELLVKLSPKDILYNIHHPGNLGGGVIQTVHEQIPTAQGCW